MRAFAVERFGGPGSLLELPRPTLARDGISIRVKAAGVNPIDWKLADGGKPGLNVPFPFVLGQDCAGIVEAVGPEVSRFRAGDEVFGACWLNGTYAEYVAVSPERAAIARKPARLDFVQAAAMPTPTLAALACVKALNLRKGQTVLIVGATGGVGAYAVQLAALAGARVVATAREQDVNAMMALGASETIDHGRSKVVDAVQSRHPHGLDALIDVVSPRDTLEHMAKLLRPGGHLATTTHAADVAALAAQGITAINVDVLGTTDGLDEIATLTATGQLRAPSVQMFALDAAATAVALSRSGRTRGKLVLSIA